MEKIIDRDLNTLLDSVKEVFIELVKFTWDESTNSWVEKIKKPQMQVTFDKNKDVYKIIDYGESQSSNTLKIVRCSSKNKLLLKEVLYDKGKILYQTVYEFDINGNKTAITYDLQENIIEKSIYSLHAESGLESFSSYNVNGTIKAKTIFTRLDKGYWSKKTFFYGENNVVQYTHTETYSDSGKITKFVVQRHDTSKARMEADYDILGNEIKRSFYLEDEFPFEQMFYDVNGNITKHIIKKNTGNYITQFNYNYIYNRYNHWINKQILIQVLEPNGSVKQYKHELQRNIIYRKRKPHSKKAYHLDEKKEQ